MSCSEDGSVRMWEIQDLPLPAEPASAGETHVNVTQVHRGNGILFLCRVKRKEISGIFFSPCVKTVEFVLGQLVLDKKWEEFAFSRAKCLS